MTRDLEMLYNFGPCGFPLWYLEQYEQIMFKISKSPIRTDYLHLPGAGSVDWQKQVREYAAFVNWGCNLLIYYTNIV